LPLDHFRDACRCTRDVGETAEAIFKLVTLCEEGRSNARDAPPMVEGAPARRLDTNTPETALAAMLTVFPGMSLSKGRAVAEEVGCMHALCDAMETRPRPKHSQGLSAGGARLCVGRKLSRR
jgi:hypothetical protein